MLKVYENEQLVWVAQAQQWLESHGVMCSIRNEFTSNVMGEVPFIEVWPELWIHDNGQMPKAQSLLKQWLSQMQTKESEHQQLPDWQCVSCGEDNDGHYAMCWSCGHQLEEA